ncbi:MAG: hypothetical protein LC754_17085, partial [Acidobacteria bacterium]|nr:hypothetical protein [Acidobacteriota bacterium]
MKKSLILGVLLSLLAVWSQSVFAQSRARRVGQTAPQTNGQAKTPAPAATTTRTTPSSTTAGAPRTQEVSEEVGADEVVRVNTALVTIPVQIMDRDGRFIPNLR